MSAIRAGSENTTWKYGTGSNSASRLASHSRAAAPWHFGQCRLGQLMVSPPLAALWANSVMESWRLYCQPPNQSPCFCSPLRSCFEQGDEPVWRPEGAFAKMGWNDCLDGFELFCWIATRVDFGGLQIAVAEPQRHLPNVLRRLQDDHSAGVSQHVRRELLAEQ